MYKSYLCHPNGRIIQEAKPTDIFVSSICELGLADKAADTSDKALTLLASSVRLSPSRKDYQLLSFRKDTPFRPFGNTK